MNRIAGRAGIVILLVLLLLGGFTFFLVEYFVNAGDWVVFSGSPHVYNGANIGCGVVTDSEGLILLDTEGKWAYTPDELLRKATVHWVGDRYGSIDAPALSNHASDMVGYDFFSGVYSYGETGGVATLTLSAAVQKAALEAMGDYKGTVAVYNYKTGQLLCAVTTPTYDPNAVPEAAEGMYLNRFTQSVYIPGSIFKIVTLAAALDYIPDVEQQTFTCTGRYEIGADAITCEGAHWDQSLKEAFRNSCNCAFAQIAQQLGGDVLEAYVQQFGIIESVVFDGITTATGNFEAADTAEVNVAWSGIGQYKDQVNPCAFLTFVGAIAGEGKGAQPYLVERIKVGNETTYDAKTKNSGRIMSASTAATIREYMRYNVTDKYGDEYFPGLQVAAKTGTGEVGGGKRPNAMLTGFVEDDQYPLAFIVAVEEGGYGREVCIPIISKVLSICKEEMS